MRGSEDDLQVLLNDGLVLVDASAGPVTITLPPVSQCRNEPPFRVKKIDATANAVTIVGYDGDEIDQDPAGTTLLAQYQSKDFKRGDAEWWIV